MSTRDDRIFANAAMETGVAKYPIKEWDAYKKSLDKTLSEHIRKINELNV